MSAPKVTPSGLATAWVQPEIEPDRDFQRQIYHRPSYAQDKAEFLASLAEHFYHEHRAAGKTIKKAREAASSDAARVVLARHDLFTRAQVEKVRQYGVGYSPDNLKKRVNRRSPEKAAVVENNRDLSAGITPEHYIYELGMGPDDERLL